MKRFFPFHVSMVTVVCGLLAVSLGCTSEQERGKDMPPPLVSVMTVESRDVPVINTFVGQTEGSRAVEVRAQVSGILMSRSYEEGQYVEKGKLLFEIEPDTYKAALAQAKGVMAQAQAKFVQSKQDLDRVLPLYAKNAVSQRDRDLAQSTYNSAKADLDAAKASVNEAEIKLSYAYVTAPVSGYAGKEYRTVGNLITAGSLDGSLLTVVNKIDPIYANFSIPSPQFMRMRTLTAQGRLKMETVTAEVSLADGSPYETKGKVTFVDKQVNPGTSVVAARAEFVNPNLLVLPGQFVRVSIFGAVLVDAILIPQKAVIQTQKGSMVVVVDKDGKAEMRTVDLGGNYGDSFLLNKGLVAGERIVVEGSNKAVPGQPVRIQPDPVKASDAAPAGAPASASPKQSE